MNHNLSPRELRRWHAWFDKPYQHPLDAEYNRLYKRWWRTKYESAAYLRLDDQLNELYCQMLERENNPSRCDPRNGARP